MVSDALPPRLQGKALVTEPTAKLIGIMDIQPDGGGYKASDGFNLLASTDEWMSPIFADVGPDGADLGDRFLQLHHPAQPDAERPIRGRSGHDRARRRLQDGERSARPNSRPHLSRRLEGRSEEFHQIPRQGEARRTRGGARQRQPVLEPHRPAPDRGQQDDGRRSGVEEARAIRHRWQRRDPCPLVARRNRRARQGHASSGAARQGSRPAPQRHSRPARERGRTPVVLQQCGDSGSRICSRARWRL